MNIYDIAKLCGVSTATVSRVINGGSVSEQTRARVLDVLAKTGYQPNPYAQGMNLGSMSLIGVLVSEIDDLYYVQAVSTIERRLRKLGYDIILYSVGKNPAQIRKYIDGLVSRKVDAIFTVGSVFHSVEVQLNHESGIPIITINLETENNNCYNIFCDDANAVSDAVHMLYDKGHRGFLYLYDTDTINGTAKIAGFRSGVEECRLGAGQTIVYNCPRDIEAAQSAAAKILGARPDITAVLTSVDDLAVGVIKAGLALGRRIPGNLAVIGYDNSILSESSSPRITTIDNRVADLCMLGVDLFSDLRAGKPVAKKYILNCKLIEKETT